MANTNTVLLCVFLIAITPPVARGDNDTYVPPKAGSNQDPAIGVVFIQGASIPSAAYVPLIEAVQNASSFAVSGYVPAFPLDTPEPLVVGGGVARALKFMRARGLPADAPVVVMAHSLGGAMGQDWVRSHPAGIAAQVLMGAAISRSNRKKGAYPVPTLTLDGTLDGLYRVTRQAETYFHAQLHPASPAAQSRADFPVVVYEGVSHMQFASGPPPALVKAKDLKPAVANDAAHAMMGATVGKWLAARFGADAAAKAAAAAALAQEVAATGPRLAPLVAALQLEANPNLVAPCDSDFPLPASCPAYPKYPANTKTGANAAGCACGTPWSAVAQRQMGAGLSANVAWASADAVHSVSDIDPVHLPHIWSPTCADEARGCTINVTTVTQAVYSALNPFDTGFSYTSASELRAKLKSRQSLYTAAGRKDVNFTETDVDGSRCAEINQLAWRWALDHAGADATARFDAIGEPYAMGPDVFKGNVGPLWIYNPLQYNEAKDKSVVTLDAPCSHTPMDYPIKAAAGYHYCKLLSPARAMEWLYIDSLRAKGSLNSPAAEEEEAVRAAAPTAKCPDLTAYRSDRVLAGFDEHALTGMWYEQAYIDVAQLGASCQTMNGTKDAGTNGGVTFEFAFVADYPVLGPFTLHEQLTPRNGDDGKVAAGYYTKVAKMPLNIGKLLTIPTVFVDVTRGNATRADGSVVPYETMTQYSCLDVLGAVPIKELVFATRAKEPDADVLAAMYASAKARGVTWNAKALKHVDHSKCKH